VLPTGISLFALYLLLVGQVTTAELTAALVTAGLAAAYAREVRRHAQWQFRSSRVPWLHLIGNVSHALVQDTALVADALVRGIWGYPPRGCFARQPFRPGDRSPYDTSRRGMAILATSIPPNSYAIDILGDAQALLLHRLTPQPTNPDQEWPA
jgi:hypothetical protein